jgi:DNA-binding NtrC family response regulator
MDRLLIADTQKDWCEFAWGVLSKHRYEVSTACDVETLRRLLAENGYDLILVNVDLMGSDFGKPIHNFLMAKLEEPIVVVAMPGWGAEVVQQTRMAFKSGAMDCVDKPLSSKPLLDLVRHLLEEFRERSSRQQKGAGLCQT